MMMRHGGLRGIGSGEKKEERGGQEMKKGKRFGVL